MISRLYTISIPQYERVQTEGGFTTRKTQDKVVRVELEIDDIELVFAMAGRADRSKGRRSTRAGGMVRVKILKEAA